MSSSQPSEAASGHGHDDDGGPSLLKLPNEMLLDIAHKLEGDNESLAALTKTTKHLKSIAEGALYKFINLPRNTGGRHGAYLVRTLLENPSRAAQVSKISLTLTIGTGADRDTMNIASQPDWVALMMKHFANFNHECIDIWTSQVFSAWTDAVTLMLFTLLPRAVNVELFIYERPETAAPYIERRQTARDELVMLNAYLKSLFVSSLGQVKRLAVLGGTLRIMRCCENVEVVDLNLVGQRLSEDNSYFWNVLDESLPGLMFGIAKHLHTLVVRGDWSLLRLNGHQERRSLGRIFVKSRFPALSQIKIYITRGPRVRSAKDASFAYLRETTTRLAKILQGLTIDYIDGPALRPKALLGECSRMDSLGTFTKLRNLTALQEVLISTTDRRRIESWESSTSTFLPPALETLTVLCPTGAVIRWLQVLTVTGAPASLREVVLLCRLGHGAAPTDFDNLQANNCFRDLLNKGITVTVKEEVPGAFKAHSREHGSVWEADWAEENWTGDLYMEE